MIGEKSPDFGGPRLWSCDHSPELEEWEKNWWTTEEPDCGRATTVMLQPPVIFLLDSMLRLWSCDHGRTPTVSADFSPGLHAQTVVVRPQSDSYLPH